MYRRAGLVAVFMGTRSGGDGRSEADRAAAHQGERAQDQQKTSRQLPHGVWNLSRLSASNNRLHKGVVTATRPKGMPEDISSPAAVQDALRTSARRCAI